MVFRNARVSPLSIFLFAVAANSTACAFLLASSKICPQQQLSLKASQKDSPSDKKPFFDFGDLTHMAASVLLMTAPLTLNAPPAMAAIEQQQQQMPTPSTSILMSANNNNNDGPQGISAVTQSELGKSVRGSVVGGAKMVDRLDLKWERFSDSLRDESKCDPRTNRRMFDNGKRRDGTPIGNPVLGALCTPEPLKDLDEATAKVVLDLGNEAAMITWKVDPGTLQKKQEQVQKLVGPAFSRAVSSLQDGNSNENAEGGAQQLQASKRQTFNGDLYTEMRAFGELSNSNDKSNRENARLFELTWGDKLLAQLAPNADRKDYTSPFPKPDKTEDQPYDEEGLLDALGAVSVALNKLQQGGVIGHWEISIPEDDDWNVVTIAVDDDITVGGQILGRERQQPVAGSEVVALVRASLENKAKIPYRMDTFYIDPTTTKQELYDPTQLLISLSDLGQ